MTTKQDYRNFISNTLWPWCWICGRDGQQKPEWWHAPWILHRAHIASTPRNEDPRVIVIACPWCHGIRHGTRFAAEKRPPITLANMLWAKEVHDAANYCPEFMQHFAVKRLPTPEAPHELYLAEYKRRHRGEVLIG